MKNQVKLLFAFFLGVNNKFRFQAKIVHWEADSHAQHTMADDFHALILAFEDLVAERIGGIIDKFTFTDFEALKSMIDEIKQESAFADIQALKQPNTLRSLIDAYLIFIQKYYEAIPDTTKFKGLKSDFESQIAELNTLRYLASMT